MGLSPLFFSKKNVFMKPHEEQIWQLAEPLLASVGMELVQVECLRMKTRWVVRVFMDREEGVTLDDCAEISNQLGDLLDIHDVPPGPYTLEVSSPGLDRPLFRDRDFLKYRGFKISLCLAEKIEGRRDFRAELVEYEESDDGKLLVVKVEGKTFRIPRDKVVKANLEYEL